MDSIASQSVLVNHAKLHNAPSAVQQELEDGRQLLACVQFLFQNIPADICNDQVSGMIINHPSLTVKNDPLC